MHQILQSDIRDILFKDISEKIIIASVSAKMPGVLSGVNDAVEAAKALGITVLVNLRDGMPVNEGETILMLKGTPKQISVAEETMIGFISKASGIASAAADAVSIAKGRARIVCGSIKKIPYVNKNLARHAIIHGGADIRIAPLPFVYLDKNYIRMLGSVKNALTAASGFENHTLVIQIRDQEGGLESEVISACKNGADILMIDTGASEDIDRTLETVNKIGAREKVQIAFAGDVNIEDVEALVSKDIDILCIGRAIADAPLLDIKFDVIEVLGENTNSFSLMEKSELWIENISIQGVDLGRIAELVAEVLSLHRSDVLVVDVRPDNITLDILCKSVDLKAIAGKEGELLCALKSIEGVKLADNSFIHSRGILGMISLDEISVPDVLANTGKMVKRILNKVNRRALIFPTGFELQQGMILDSNSPMIAERLRRIGFTADIAPVVADDKSAITNALLGAVDGGYGLLITTGGVGAEDKDWTIEAVLEIDHEAAVPWIVKYHKGEGRHVKQGVRIAVARAGITTIISLPGPNDEVAIALDVLEKALAGDIDKYELANALAEPLRNKLMNKWNHQSGL